MMLLVTDENKKKSLRSDWRDLSQGPFNDAVQNNIHLAQVLF